MQQIKLDRNTDYKTRRTTLALVIASYYLYTQTRAALREALSEVQEKNYDFERVDQGSLETIYAEIDDDVLAKVQSEYAFFPRMGSIVDHHKHVAHCALCGKGDSKDDGTNEDKLRYTFLLTNTAGGSDLWVGSTCIMNYGLKVDGAANAAEAKAMLAKTLRDHIAEWKKEAWRQAHPEHVDIPKHYVQLCDFSRWIYREAWRTKFRFVMRTIVHHTRSTTETYKAAKMMGNVSRFYARFNYLTPDKERKWKAARETLDYWMWIRKLSEDIENMRESGAESYLRVEQAKRAATGLAA